MCLFAAIGFILSTSLYYVSTYISGLVIPFEYAKSR